MAPLHPLHSLAYQHSNLSVNPEAEKVGAIYEAHPELCHTGVSGAPAGIAIWYMGLNTGLGVAVGFELNEEGTRRAKGERRWC